MLKGMINMRLLLVEDEKMLSSALVTILKHNNYAVDAVYNGKDAIDYLSSEIYDGVILDIMLPKVDGITVLKTIRSNGNMVPVILLTAKAEVDDRVLGLDSGADDYLTKPFSSAELLARIRAITRRTEEVKNTSQTYCDLTLDYKTFELSTKTGKVLLTSKEFQIMELFFKNTGRFISLERIMDKVWGYETETDISVIWTYISFLRKKLKAISSTVSIKAVRNIGYTRR